MRMKRSKSRRRKRRRRSRRRKRRRKQRKRRRRRKKSNRRNTKTPGRSYGCLKGGSSQQEPAWHLCDSDHA